MDGGSKSVKRLDSIKFTCYNAHEIRKLSVKEVTNPRSLDSLLNPTVNGLYDPVFGPVTRLDVCETCSLSSSKCPGHLGHIELPLPVYHPLFVKTICFLLKSTCFFCHRLMLDHRKLTIIMYKLKALNEGLYHLLDEIEAVYQLVDKDVPADVVQTPQVQLLEIQLKKMYQAAASKQTKPKDIDFHSKYVTDLRKDLIKDFQKFPKKAKCNLCGSATTTIRMEQNKIFRIETSPTTNETSQHYMNPIEVRDHLTQLWKNDSQVIEKVFGALHDASVDEVQDENTDTEDSPKRLTPSAVDVLFLTVLAVPAPRYRPTMSANGQTFENPQTTIYSKIILDSLLLRTLATRINDNDKLDEVDVTEGVSATGKTNMWKRGNDPELSDKSLLMLATIPGKTKAEKMHTCWSRLQRHIENLFDSDSAKLAEQAAEQCPGIKQKLEKKAGLFRQNMMGKRVNFAARSVISPDPYIATNEIGLPLCFATNLTYPTPVTSWNFKMLKQCVLNGPNVYPGATAVQRADGTVVKLKENDPTQRQALAKQLYSQQAVSKKRKTNLNRTQIVFRHVQNGDVMMLNRQPTLHKGSMMAHKVRVLPGEKTLRLHYANCKSYNADFDGDEMNAHFPQSELSRAEAFTLMSTDSQYLTCKDGTPLTGLIQDHTVAAIHMSSRDRLLTREQYHQLCFNALTHMRRKIKLLPPTILKPKKLWTGKQVISTVLLNIVPAGSPLLNLQGSSKIRSSDWQVDERRCGVGGLAMMCESVVVIRQCELLCGVIDKNHCGNARYGLVHSMFELYGCQYSGELLTCLARVFTAFLQQYRGFTLGVEDILVTKDGDELRTSVINETLDDGQADLANALDMRNSTDIQEIKLRLEKAHALKVMKTEDKLATVDRAMKKASNNINDQIAKYCTGDSLFKTFPKNNLQLMVKGGAKGGQVNCMQISCLLGQIELEGRRPPLMASGRSVPAFQPYDISLRAGGFITQRFLTGIRPQEYFFHCMAGREGLVDTAVKTSRSGYLQRCLVKHLEGIVLSYDMTVRDSDGSIMQFMYGEDGLDICKEPYLNISQEKFLVDNFTAENLLLPSLDVIESSTIDMTTAEKKWRKFSRMAKRKLKTEKKIRKERGEVGRRNSPFLEYCWENPQLKRQQAISGWLSLTREMQQSFKDKIETLQVPPPINSQLRPDLYLGSVSENFRDNLERYLQSNPANLPEEESRSISLPSIDSVKSMMTLKYQKSLCQPGESVGLVAAQSLGEPSTQMTLNTFHFAGRGEMNVTLGIPRLREILMNAANKVKTPQLMVPVLPGQQRRAEKLQKKFSSVRLSQVVHKIHVEERLDLEVEETGQRTQKSKIKIELLPEKQFKKELGLKRKSVLNFIEDRFLGSLVSVIAHRLRQRRREEIIFSQTAGSDDAGSRNKGGDDETLDAPDVDVNEITEEQDEDFDEDDAKRGKNKEDFEEDEEDDENMEVAVEEQPAILNESTENVDETVAAESTVDMKDVQSRIHNVLQAGIGEIRILEYDFDYENNGWCKILMQLPLTNAHVNVASVIETEAKNTFVRKVSGITRCMLQTNPVIPDQVKFVTEGINFYKLFEYPEILDLPKLQCNCVHSVEKTYGIEAASRVISQEVARVFGVYGINVNPRHLSLVADYMCFSGTYTGFNRRGIASCASPIQQMTFESTLMFLKDTALGGRWDALQSPSARLAAGEVVKNGSGSFAIKVNV